MVYRKIRLVDSRRGVYADGLLPLIRDHYPDLDLSLREAQTQHLVDELRDGGLDPLLLALPVEHPED